MAKKKTNPIVYTGFNNAPQSEIIQEQVSQIPAYEDSGIKYQGKFKVQKGLKEYELKRQETRFYSFAVGTNAAGTTVFTRPRETTKFYATKCLVQYYNFGVFAVGNYFTFGDRKNSVNTQRFYYFPVQASGEFFIDFSDCPRKFEGDQVFITCPAALGANSFIVFHIFGWEEQD
jgi:hypothetical protein